MYIFTIYIHLYLSIFIQWFMMGFSLVCLFLPLTFAIFFVDKRYWLRDNWDRFLSKIQRLLSMCCGLQCLPSILIHGLLRPGRLLSIASWENEQLHAAGIWIKFTLKDHLFQSKSGLQRWTLNSRGKMLLKNSADVVSWLLNNKNKSAKNHESTNLFLWSIRCVGFSLEPTTSWDFSAF